MLSAHVGVVSYRNSTSNHNHYRGFRAAPGVVSYRNSTSNHNVSGNHFNVAVLYLIEILHQTTTFYIHIGKRICCILSKFYIKPQPIASPSPISPRCILSKFYIKPQLIPRSDGTGYSCILSKFYIKPQHHSAAWQRFYVVSYRNSTSNHNSNGNPRPYYPLYLIEILHQTTTCCIFVLQTKKLYLIEILHQTTTMTLFRWPVFRCILSKFYIKPQLALQ